jgi:hypothetical protein
MSGKTRATTWIHLVATAILILAAAACWVVLCVGLFEVIVQGHVGGWNWNNAFALTTVCWLAALTTYMSMYGIAKAGVGGSAWQRRLAWGRLAVRGATMLFCALIACATVLAPDSNWGPGRGGALLLAGMLLWFALRRRRSP